jgi:hypothetical protein
MALEKRAIVICGATGKQGGAGQARPFTFHGPGSFMDEIGGEYLPVKNGVLVVTTAREPSTAADRGQGSATFRGGGP